VAVVFISDLYKEYHDQEWELQFYDDLYFIYEFYYSETFQTSLSWITILNKREKIFRTALQ
jgi:DNA-3-methyladenine glycosylase I